MATAMKMLASLLARQVLHRHVTAASQLRQGMLGISAQHKHHACDEDKASSSLPFGTSSIGHQQWQQQQQQEQLNQQQLTSTSQEHQPQPSNSTHAGMFMVQGWLLSPQMQHAAAAALQQHGAEVWRASSQQPVSSPVEEPGCVAPVGDQEPSQGPMVCGKRGTSYQPSRRKRVNSHGLEKRLGMPGGRNALMRRLFKKKRARLTVDCFV